MNTCKHEFAAWFYCGKWLLRIESGLPAGSWIIWIMMWLNTSENSWSSRNKDWMAVHWMQHSSNQVKDWFMLMFQRRRALLHHLQPTVNLTCLKQMPVDLLQTAIKIWIGFARPAGKGNILLPVLERIETIVAASCVQPVGFAFFGRDSDTALVS